MASGNDNRRFAPIAVVGQACLLPGAAAPEQLWQLVIDGRSAIGPCPEGRWRVPRARVLAEPGGATRDRTICDRGGYVDGFEAQFDPTGFAIPPSEITGLDPLFRWLLHVGREALCDARQGGPLDRAGAVIGNLSYPSASLSCLAERTWLDDQPTAFPWGGAAERFGVPVVDPRNRFMSGLPAHVLARALGLGSGAFALDAACASSLYAIKLACDWLHEGRADLMLAGAVNCADDLFIHVGFTALGALSPHGRSRPFDAAADGLVPAEGAAVVVLRRLEDAERDGDRILGVIRGVGLSNDGRGRGFLVPSEEGQVRALRAAYLESGIAPAEISFVECHATGTLVGDAVEIRSLAEVFGGRSTALPLGSLKANLGHLITAAGVAGLLKVLGALRAGVLPPMPVTDRLNAALDGTPLRIPRAAEPWKADGPRYAAVSAFGFGGNNAHLIVAEAPAKRHHTAAQQARKLPPPAHRPAVAIVSVGAIVADGECTADFADAMFFGRSRIVGGAARAQTIALPLRDLRFPPHDLEATLPQQLMVFAAAQEALQHVSALPAARTGVFVGMQCDAEVCRHGARWRAAGWSDAAIAPDGWMDAARDGFVAALGAAGVVGAMPNIVANRLNRQFDLGGPSMAVSAEELSGVRALEIARGALERGEIDAAVVGAVDLAAEPVHMAAIAALSADRSAAGGDAAIVLIVKRLEDARRDADRILAVLSDPPPTTTAVPGAADSGHDSVLRIGDAPDAISLEPLFGHPHAVAGLLSVAGGALCCAHRAQPSAAGSGSIAAWPSMGGRRRAAITIRALGGQTSIVWLEESPAEDSGDDPGELTRSLAALRSRSRASDAPTLRFAAHQPPPKLPPLPVVAPATLARAYDIPAPEIMAPAPQLPPVAAMEQMRDVRPAVEAPADPIAARHAHYHTEVAALHQQFVDQQASLHRQFLDNRERAVALLLTTRTHAGTGAAALLALAPAFDKATRPPLPVTARPAALAPPITARGRTSGAPRTRFSRRDLEVHASGKISDVFGPLFASQDAHAIQVRMPEPPLLLADRVVGLEAEAGSMGLGTVWTETDVSADSWYLNRGFMPAGIMIEAGQADLFLISNLGVDALNQGQRAYRLLGCELTYHGSLPARGDTLRYEIHIDGHARQGDVRLFAFHYDCLIGGRRALTVRHGQAGFFSRDELEQSAGVLWSPEGQEPRAGGRVDPPVVACTRRDFSAAEIEAFSRGDLHGCFGAGFEAGQAHVRSPAIQNGRMLLIERIGEFDPGGGPWKRGYLKAITSIHPDDWFFAGHFKNDPCMPGTLMFEGCLQAMSFYLAGLGYTLDRDGWRFEPVPDEPYKLQCRGQVLPSSKELVCELFVEEVHAGPFPTVYADLLGTIDGLKAFHARRVGLRLVPDWPLSTRLDLESEDKTTHGADDAGSGDGAELTSPPASADGFRFDDHSLLACAWGRPSDAFGAMYRVFDGTRRVARLPGPPYHFMSRVVRLDAAQECKAGGRIEIEYDVPADAWYFNQNGCTTMPFCILLEAVLQPCGWLASYVGSALLEQDDLSFRNLDGKGVVLAEIPPGTRTLRTSTTLTSISRSGGMILETFDVRCWAGDVLVYTLQTGFGFFPKAALEHQVGLSTTPEQRAQHDAPAAGVIDLTARPPQFFEGSLRLPGPMLLMIDRVTSIDPSGGRAGLGFVRAEKDVDPAEWFFKAHFFQDPVQPGSLGLEAMLQTLQFFMIHQGLGDRPGQRFEPIALGRPMVWKYRGQVVPRDRRITITLEVTETGREAAGEYAVADASLWVDGRRIYHATGLGMRSVRSSMSGGRGEAEAVSPSDAPGAVRVRGTWREQPPAMFLPRVSAFWRNWFGVTAPVVHDMYRGLIDRFLGAVAYEDEDAIAAACRRPVLFLGNHQTAVESTIFAIVTSALVGAPLLTLAKIENRRHWLDLLMRHTFRHPRLRDPEMTKYFEREDRESLLRILDELAAEMTTGGRSVMVHVEGTRGLSCRRPVRTMSGTFVDLAMRLDCPIVPVRFVGGLPSESLTARTEFPVGMGRQQILIGRPIASGELRDLSYRERSRRVRSGINSLGLPNEAEAPLYPQPVFEAAVRDWMTATGVDAGHAAIFRILESLPDGSAETRRLVAAARSGRLQVGSSSEELWLAECGRRLFGARGPVIGVQTTPDQEEA